MKAMKKLILCADDYGQNEEISQGILDLIDHKILTATSCMTNLPQWPKYASQLKTKKNIDKGVHLNFTYGTPLNPLIKKTIGNWPNSIFKLMTYVLLTKKITLNLLKKEITLQINAFEQVFNQQPNFIDGHQHLHHFPAIQRAFLEVYLEKYDHLNVSQRPYIRIATSSTKSDNSNWLKKKIIQWTGSESLKRQAIKNQIPHNKQFAGIYSYTADSNFESVIIKTLSSMNEDTLMMCHPGLLSSDINDPINNNRYKEYMFLKSSQFKELLNRYNVRLANKD